MAFAGLYGGVQTKQRQTTTQIPIGFCTNLLLSVPVCPVFVTSVSCLRSSVHYYEHISMHQNH